MSGCVKRGIRSIEVVQFGEHRSSMNRGIPDILVPSLGCFLVAVLLFFVWVLFLMVGLFAVFEMEDGGLFWFFLEAHLLEFEGKGLNLEVLDGSGWGISYLRRGLVGIGSYSS